MHTHLTAQLPFARSTIIEMSGSTLPTGIGRTGKNPADPSINLGKRRMYLCDADVFQMSFLSCVWYEIAKSSERLIDSMKGLFFRVQGHIYWPYLFWHTPPTRRTQYVLWLRKHEEKQKHKRRVLFCPAVVQRRDEEQAALHPSIHPSSIVVANRERESSRKPVIK